MIALNILMRFLHIISVITLLGGVLAWRLGVASASASLAPETSARIGNAFSAAWRPIVIYAVIGILVSGTYNFLNKTGVPPAWQAVFGIKFLLALHVFAVTIIAFRLDNPRRTRQLTGVMVSGVIIVILSAVLRWLSTP